MGTGWIKLYRQIQECDFLWDSADEPFDRRSAWIDLLLLANHKDKRILFNGKTISVGMGQRLTSMRDLAERWHWSRGKVKRYFDLLEAEGMIVRESDKRKTLLTIVNYSKFQGEQATDEPLIDPQTEPQNDHQKSHRQSINKNDKNEKNDKKDIYGEFGHVRLSDKEKEKLFAEYGETATMKAIKAVDEYCQQYGKKYKDYYLTIRKWGIDAGRREKDKSSDFDLFYKHLEEGGYQ